MAAAFLARLPSIGRGILAKEDQCCVICMEEYGTVPSDSGTTERAVRLPCGHIFGSECISIWLTQTGGATENNTCPLCRHVLFRLLPPGMSPAWTEAELEHLRIRNLLAELCEHLSALLRLSVDTMCMARCIANRFHHRHQIEMLEIGDGLLGDGPVHVVAVVSVYMATHIFGDGRSLDLVSSLDGVEVQAARKAYASLYGYRYALISTDLLARAGRGWHQIEEILPSVMA